MLFPTFLEQNISGRGGGGGGGGVARKHFTQKIQEKQFFLISYSISYI